MSNQPLHILYTGAVALLQQLIATPSLSKAENKTAAIIEYFLKEKNITCHRLVNNVWAVNKFFDENKPSILLNSHHDTVAANAGYTRNPYEANIENGKLFGLGSTDAGASLVSLLAAFLFYYANENLSYNIVFAAAAEEEISGVNGIEKLFAEAAFKNLFAHKYSFAIVGEPTQLQLAVAEKGLLVLDCIAYGTASHAANITNDNAIYKAMQAIEWFKNYSFDKISPLLGAIKMTVTSIQTENKIHNIVPATCSFIVDIRINECYTATDVLTIIKENVAVEIIARSTRLRATIIDTEYVVIKAGIVLGKTIYGSPTMSDKALIPLPTLKCGPGNSLQSHTANEFVVLKDVNEGIEFYVQLLGLVLNN